MAPAPTWCWRRPMSGHSISCPWPHCKSTPSTSRPALARSRSKQYPTTRRWHMSSRVESVEVPGGSFDLPVWLPDAGSGPGLLLIQEIFGISDYIRDVAEDLAALGYVVGAPDLFWRLEPGYRAVHDQEGLTRSLEMGSRFDADQGV